MASDTPTWTTYGGVEHVRIYAEKLGAGAWRARVPYEGGAFVVDDDMESLTKGIAAEMMRVEHEEGAQLPHMLSVAFIDETVVPRRDRVVKLLGYRFRPVEDEAA